MGQSFARCICAAVVACVVVCSAVRGEAAVG